MSLNFKSGKLICEILNSSDKNKKIFLDENATGADSFVCLESESLFPYLNTDPNDSSNVIVFGLKGSGKSTLVASLVKQIWKVWGKKKTLLYSGKTYDKPLDDLGVVRVPLFTEGEAISTPAPNRIAIFDDVDGIPEPKVVKEIHQIIKNVGQTGRSDKIDMFFVGHVHNDGHTTKYLWREADYVIVFIKTMDDNCEEYIKKQFGYTEDTMQRLCASKSRWALLSRHHPRYIVTEREVWIPSTKRPRHGQ